MPWLTLVLLSCGSTNESLPSGTAVPDSGPPGGDSAVVSGDPADAAPVGTGGGSAGAPPSDGGGSAGTPALDGAALKPLTKFVGMPLGEALTWGSGQGLIVESVNGDIDVVQGNSTSVAATFEPFVWRAFDTPDSEILEDFALLETVVMTDVVLGMVIVRTSRQSGAPSTLGANIIVELPASFDAELEVNQRNGTTRVLAVAAAATLNVDSTNGDVEANTGSVRALAVSTALGDVDATLEDVPVNAVGGRFVSEMGNVSLSVPTQASFSVMAIAETEVRTGTVPAQCMVAEAAINSKTLTCNGGGPIYEAQALGFDGIVALSFQ